MTKTPRVWECVHRASKESSMLPRHKEVVRFFYYKQTAVNHSRVVEAETLLTEGNNVTCPPPHMLNSTLTLQVFNG
jgi:hypothetical protein